MFVAMAQWILSICLLWSLAYLVVLCSRKRLPFYEGEVVETRLTASAARTGRSRFVVRFRLSLPGGRSRKGAFPFLLAGELEHVRGSERYRELQTYYSDRKPMKAHYVPYCEWLFGLIPEAPRITQRAALIGICAILVAVMVWILQLLHLLPV